MTARPSYDLVLAAGTMQGFAIAERIDAARDAGFNGMSLFAADLEAAAREGIDAAEIGRRIADAGLWVSEVEIIGRWLPGASAKPGLDPGLLDLIERMTPEYVIALAHAVGARGVSIADLLGIAAPLTATAEHFAAICGLADAAGLYVALEFIPTGSIPDLDAATRIVEAANVPNGGLMIDSWHFFRSGSQLSRLEEMAGRTILAVQIGDAPAAAEADLDYAMAHDRLLPGDGELDLAGFLAALARTGTNAPIAVEVFSDQLARGTARDAANACMCATRRLIEGEFK